MAKVGGRRDELVFACLYEAIYYLCHCTSPPAPRTREESYDMLQELFLRDPADANMLRLDALGFTQCDDFTWQRC